MAWSSLWCNAHVIAQEPRKPSYAEICQRIREAPTQQPLAESKPTAALPPPTEDPASLDSAEPRCRETRPVSAKPAPHRAREAWKCHPGVGDVAPQSWEPNGSGGGTETGRALGTVSRPGSARPHATDAVAEIGACTWRHSRVHEGFGSLYFYPVFIYHTFKFELWDVRVVGLLLLDSGIHQPTEIKLGFVLFCFFIWSLRILVVKD